MKLLPVIFAVLTLANAEIFENKSRYDYYRLYNVEFSTDEQLKIFKELEKRSDSYTFIGHARYIGHKLSIMVSSQKIGEITDLLERFKVKHEILVYNFQDKIDEEWKTVKPSDTPGSDMDWSHYFHIETIYDWMDQLVLKYPSILEPLNLGNSYEGQPIKGIKLSRKNGNTGIFVEAGIHAREWISPATITYILNELLTSNNDEIKVLSTNYDWYIFPIINPDGYRYTFRGDRMWRKSRKPYGLCVGTDLNRNFDFHWNETGSSPDPCSYDYAGSAPNSDVEAKLMSEFIIKNQQRYSIKTFLSLHSYSQLIMFPFGYTAEKIPNYDDMKFIGDKAVEAIARRNNTIYKSGSISEIIYPTSGGSKDWVYSIAKIPITFTFELRGPTTSSDLFILPANQIIDTAAETLDAFVAILTEAEKLHYYD